MVNSKLAEGNWTAVDERSNITFGNRSTTLRFDISHPRNYDAYRIAILDIVDRTSNSMQLAEFFLENKPKPPPPKPTCVELNGLDTEVCVCCGHMPVSCHSHQSPTTLQRSHGRWWGRVFPVFPVFPVVIFSVLCPPTDTGDIWYPMVNYADAHTHLNIDASRRDGCVQKAAESADKLFDGHADTKLLFEPKIEDVNGYNITIRALPTPTAEPVVEGQVAEVAMPAATALFAYAITSANDFPGRDPKHFTVKGRVDADAEWVTLDVQTNVSFANRYDRGVRACWCVRSVRCTVYVCTWVALVRRCRVGGWQMPRLVCCGPILTSKLHHAGASLATPCTMP